MCGVCARISSFIKVKSLAWLVIAVHLLYVTEYTQLVVNRWCYTANITACLLIFPTVKYDTTPKICDKINT